MRYEVSCRQCHDTVWIRAHEDPDVNGFELDMDDPRWADACVHMDDGGDFDIGEPVYDDEEED